MTVRLLFFSVLKDLTGIDETTRSLPSGATVADLLVDLYAQWPALSEWDSSLLTAVDQTYVKRSEPLHENCEVALMPPVQGG
ncbi:molybdopterin synthase catalytic subunit [Prosthecobacter fusiformis]|uniref:Molybdopterin synthase sulfur carrier subunit n=1 Tax=Prosthecobacter fusiformis TaxID=48464 RepID=A0A4R7SQB6_9BACT|nr:MoaD/ThiS family protein [Prosthecobacter fusiformis]TDU81420.1 molybdopterin synthase catalytic subunit [Prosthecobacter fusiformis]